MANYIFLPDSSYPHSESSIRAANPQTSFPAQFRPPEGYEIVFPAPAPTCDPVTQIAREITPVLTNKGHYEQAWEIVEKYDNQEDKDAAIAADQAAKLNSLITSITTATQQRLDAFARTRNYDGILSACTYATSTVPKFKAEGQYGVEARDATWSKLYEMLAEVEAGTRPMPAGFSDVEPELPVLAWPDQPT